MTDSQRDNSERVTLVCDTENGEQQFFGRYKVLQLLGEGGMGRVYKVLDTDDTDSDAGAESRVFALKTLRTDLLNDGIAVHRLRQEGQSVSTLRHPNIVTTFGIVEIEGSPFILMEFIDGVSLAELFEGAGNSEVRTNAPAVALDIAIQICDAVHYAHQHEIIHRDLKPSNILILKSESNNYLVKVVDFGIAKIQPSITDTKSGTCSNEIVGTAAYMSPEQCMGEHLDARSDIYSLGALIYEMFTGRPPFHGTSSIKTILQHLTEKPVPPTTLISGQSITEGLEPILMRCLEKDPVRRFNSVDALKKALVSERSKLSVDGQDSLLPAVVYFQNRQRLWVIFSVVGMTFVSIPVLVSATFSTITAGPIVPFLYILVCSLLRARRAEDIDEIIRRGMPSDKTVVLSDSNFHGKTLRLVQQDQTLSRHWSITTKGSDLRLSENWSKTYCNGEKRVLPVYMDENKGEPVAVLVDGSLLLVVGQIYIPGLGWR